MEQVLEMLKNGDATIVAAFVEADKKWQELLSDIDHVSIQDLAKRLSSAQMYFERICGDIYLGKVVMAWSGFSHLYSCDVGFEDNGPKAYKLFQSFGKSMCSIEVKHSVERAAEMYGVKDYS
jgi:hypothetical protein